MTIVPGLVIVVALLIPFADAQTQGGAQRPNRFGGVGRRGDRRHRGNPRDRDRPEGRGGLRRDAADGPDRHPDPYDDTLERFDTLRWSKAR